ncbi:MAG: hydrogenase maturation protease [Acidimicrobiales bacterium]
MTPDRFAAAKAVADAVLYEGYVLYPYRASSRKNQLRWQFGVLVPQAFAQLDTSERSSMLTEVLVDAGSEPVLDVRIRCLHVQQRTVEMAGATVESLLVDGALIVPWDEAVDWEFDVPDVALLSQTAGAREVTFELPAAEEIELVGTTGRVVRHRDAVQGVVRISVAKAAGRDRRLQVSIEVGNITDWCEPGAARDDVVRHSLVSVHTLLALRDGAFVSSFDPPVDATAALAACTNDGTFPVLIGHEGSADVVLSSPIILYDYPAIAPESQGDLYDATEIDEILALRILTLTDDEKAEARATDARAAAIIDRCDNAPPEVWDRLHGAVRSLQAPTASAGADAVPWWDPGVDSSVDPWTDTVWVGGVEVMKGTRVVLRPSRRADAHDLFLADQPATVAGVFHDVDGEQHVAVTLDNDPANDLFEWQGRYLYFFPDEIEPIREQTTPRILVAGIGNIFLGDDGFGVEVANRMAGMAMPKGTQVTDFGIRGVHLAYELLDGYDALVLIDAVPLGEPPGTIAVLEPEQLEQQGVDAPTLDAHSMNPAVVLGALAGLGGAIGRVLIVGCQPAVIEETMGLSEPVAAAVETAVDVVRDLVTELCGMRKETFA